jgi:hypothetical protein
VSEKALLQAIHDQLVDTIEQVRPHLPKETETLETPMDYMSGYRLRSKGLSERPVFFGEFNPKVIAYDYWPGLEPMYKLLRRVQSYIDASKTS